MKKGYFLDRPAEKSQFCLNKIHFRSLIGRSDKKTEQNKTKHKTKQIKKQNKTKITTKQNKQKTTKTKPIKTSKVMYC